MSDNTSIIQYDDAVIYVSDTIRPNSAKENAKYRMSGVRSNLKGKRLNRLYFFYLVPSASTRRDLIEDCLSASPRNNFANSTVEDYRGRYAKIFDCCRRRINETLLRDKEERRRKKEENDLIDYSRSIEKF